MFGSEVDEASQAGQTTRPNGGCPFNRVACPAPGYPHRPLEADRHAYRSIDFINLGSSKIASALEGEKHFSAALW